MKCLLVVNVQNDFLPGGSLAVPNGDSILPLVNELMASFPLVVATQDWHLPGHFSFATNHEGRQPFDVIEVDGRPQTLWPEHCVQRSAGADFPSRLDPAPIAAIFRKGMDPMVDTYSAFFDNQHAHQTGLAGYLRGLGVDEIFIAGLAAEICVAFTAEDSVNEGFRTTVIEDAIQALDETAFAEKKVQLQSHGVRFAFSPEIVATISQAA